jgi:hypothetical protein
MPRTLYRLTATPQNAGPDATQFYFDVILDETDHLTNDDLPIFGVQGDLTGLQPARLPVFIDGRGKVDFGIAYSAAERFAHTDLRDLRLRETEMVTITYQDGTVEAYKITKRTPLLVPD